MFVDYWFSVSASFSFYACYEKSLTWACMSPSMWGAIRGQSCPNSLPLTKEKEDTSGVPEVPAGGSYMERLLPSPRGPPWQHWLLWCAFESQCRLLSPPPNPGVSICYSYFVEALQAYHLVCVTALCFLRGLLLMGLFLSRSCQHSGRSRRQNVSTQSTLCQLIRGQAWSHSQEISSHCHPACISLIPHIYTGTIRPVRKYAQWQGHRVSFKSLYLMCTSI